MSGGTVFQLKITLKGTKPPIWRRIQVESKILLPDLHKVIQSVMGWTNSHLHQFILGQTYYSEPDPNDEFSSKNYNKIPLSKMLKKAKDKFVYEYDFGDGWEHEILLEKVLEEAKNIKYPLCLEGKRACPPEDCGGVWGYAELIETLANPKHPEHEEMKEWIGDDFDPEAFDIGLINKMLSEKNYGVFSMWE